MNTSSRVIPKALFCKGTTTFFHLLTAVKTTGVLEQDGVGPLRKKRASNQENKKDNDPEECPVDVFLLGLNRF